MKKKLKAILFDLDDTLYLEKDFVKSGFKAVASFIQNDNGIAVIEEDKSEICKAVKTLASDSQLRKEMGNKGRNLVKDKYSYKLIAEQFINLYEK